MATKGDTTTGTVPVDVNAPPPLDTPPGAGTIETMHAKGGAAQPNGPTMAVKQGALSGADRYAWVLSNRPADAQSGTGYIAWVQALVEDPNDLEYTRLIRALKSQVQANAGPSGETKGVAANYMSGIDHRYDVARGKPVTTQEILADQANSHTTAGQASHTQDPYLQQFADGQDLNVDYEHNKALVRSGEFVYLGDNPKNAAQSVYVYADDAKAAIWDMGAAKIKAYQKELGIPATGVPGPDLQSLWNSAVESAQLAARNGKKVSVQFIFDHLVQAQVESKAASAGGAVPQTEDDYYRAMMAVLGDISGVSNGQG